MAPAYTHSRLYASQHGPANLVAGPPPADPTLDPRVFLGSSRRAPSVRTSVQPGCPPRARWSPGSSIRSAKAGSENGSPHTLTAHGSAAAEAARVAGSATLSQVVALRWQSVSADSGIHADPSDSVSVAAAAAARAAASHARNTVPLFKRHSTVQGVHDPYQHERHEGIRADLDGEHAGKLPEAQGNIRGQFSDSVEQHSAVGPASVVAPSHASSPGAVSSTGEAEEGGSRPWPAHAVGACGVGQQRPGEAWRAWAARQAAQMQRQGKQALGSTVVRLQESLEELSQYVAAEEQLAQPLKVSPQGLSSTGGAPQVYQTSGEAETEWRLALAREARRREAAQGNGIEVSRTTMNSATVEATVPPVHSPSLVARPGASPARTPPQLPALEVETVLEDTGGGGLEPGDEETVDMLTTLELNAALSGTSGTQSAPLAEGAPPAAAPPASGPPEQQHHSPAPAKRHPQQQQQQQQQQPLQSTYGSSSLSDEGPDPPSAAGPDAPKFGRSSGLPPVHRREARPAAGAPSPKGQPPNADVTASQCGREEFEASGGTQKEVEYLSGILARAAGKVAAFRAAVGTKKGASSTAHASAAVPMMPVENQLISVLFLLVPAGICYGLQLGISRSLLLAGARSYLQLTVIGFALRYIFELEAMYPIYIAVACMVAIAGHTAANRARGVPNAQLVASACILFSAAVALTASVKLGVVPPRPRFVIPIAGIVVGSTMTIAANTMQRLADDMRAFRGQVEAALALGATPYEACGHLVRRAIRVGAGPSIDYTSTIGLIQLPGTMTGMIMGGASVPEAIALQIVVTLVLLGSCTVCCVLAGVLSSPQFFTGGTLKDYSY